MVMDALRKYWAPVFKDKPVDEAAAKAYLDLHVPDFERPLLTVPSPEALRAAFRRARPTAPGPDRLRAVAWLADERLTDALHATMGLQFLGHGLRAEG